MPVTTTTKTTALATTASLPITSLAEMERAGQLMAQTSMMGCRNPAEGFIMVATCHQEKISFLKFKQRYHIIDGNITMKAETMLSDFRKMGGKYTIKSRTPDKVEVHFECNGAEYTETILWEDMKKEKYVYGRDGKTLKDNYSSPRRRMQMMWARAVSDGVRTTCPEVTQGQYTPEEVEDFEQDKPQQTISLNEVEVATVQTPMPSEPPAMPMTPPMSMAPANKETVPAGMPEPPLTPFDIYPESQAQTAVSMVCPIEPYRGYNWNAIEDVKFLNTIVNSAFVPGIGPEHRKAIEESLKTRGN